MKFKNNFLYPYLKESPAPLAIERTFECEILSKQTFERPILDVGCGEGLFAHILFDEKIDVGIDPQKRELERCKHYGMYEELMECYGDNIPKPDKSFQTIFSNSVMEHIPQLDPVLKECHRLLADNGRMFLTLPTDKFETYTVAYYFVSLFGKKAQTSYRKFFNKFWQHYNYHSLEGWREVFERNGFKIQNHREYNPRNVCVLNDFLVPFSLFFLVNKKLFNRWILIPPLRVISASIAHLFYKSVVPKNLDKKENGGLIFFELVKK
jgi:ubiquinone/menaquinone biosynthesis C-methylase UbiE